MSLKSRQPPYTPGEIDYVASKFARREAWGCFYGSPTFKQAFGPALAKHSRQAFLAELEAGAIYAFGLAQVRDGFLGGRAVKFKDGAEPTFGSYAWLDAATLREVVDKARVREAVRGQIGHLPSAEDVASAIEAQESARRVGISQIRKQMGIA